MHTSSATSVYIMLPSVSAYLQFAEIPYLYLPYFPCNKNFLSNFIDHQTNGGISN